MFRAASPRPLMIAAGVAAAVLFALPAAAAAHEDPTEASEAAIEAASEAFEARMESFGERAEVIADDESLSETDRSARIAALWAEYQPEVAVFTAAISQHAGAIAAEALAHVDVDAMVHEALSDPEVQASIASGAAGGMAMATNGAWAQNDPEQMITYGLMAQYGLDQAMDAMDEVADADVKIHGEAAVAVQDATVALAVAVAAADEASVAQIEAARAAERAQR